MLQLLKIDPRADKGPPIVFEIEDVPGTPLM